MTNLKNLVSEKYGIVKFEDIDNELTRSIFTSKKAINEALNITNKGLTENPESTFWLKFKATICNITSDSEGYFEALEKIVSLEKENKNHLIDLAMGYRSYDHIDLSNFICYHLDELCNIIQTSNITINKKNIIEIMKNGKFS